MAAIRLPLQQPHVQVVSYAPLAVGGRGLARLRLPAPAAAAVLAAKPRLSSFQPGISVDVWRGPEERRYVAERRTDERRFWPTPGSADAAPDWRPLRSAAPAFVPRTDVAARLPSAHLPAAVVVPAAVPPTPSSPAPLRPPPTAHFLPNPASCSLHLCTGLPDAQYEPHACTVPAEALPPSPSSDPAPTAPQPLLPTGADDQAEFTVEAFVARRRVQSSLQYLVKWQGYELVGQEAAYSWQWASELSADLDQGTYRRMVRQWRQAQRDPTGGSSDDTASDASAAQRARCPAAAAWVGPLRRRMRLWRSGRQRCQAGRDAGAR